jgi:hypothetical protein
MTENVVISYQKEHDDGTWQESGPIAGNPLPETLIKAIFLYFRLLLKPITRRLEGGSKSTTKRSPELISQKSAGSANVV